MLKVTQLVEYTKVFHPNVIRYARKVKVKFISSERDKEKKDESYRKIEALCRGDTIPRYVTLMFYGPYTPSALTWASCSCEYFKYTCEVALEKQDSSEILYSNGKYPKERNTHALPCLCKHIIACIMHNAYAIKPQ